MPKGGHPAYGKACDFAHLSGIGAAQRLACKGRGGLCLDQIATCGQKQVKLPRSARKDDRFGDLVQRAARRRRCLRGCSGFGGHLNGGDVNARGMQR